MADDPWANYRQGDAAKLGAPAAAPAAVQPAPAAAAQPTPAGGDPWANYRKGGAAAMAAPPAAAPPPTSAPAPAAASDDQTSAFDPNWKSTGNAFLDFMSRPRAKTEGVGAALRDYALAGLDDVSMGYLVPKSLQSDVAQAHANIGVMDYPTAAASYAVGPGKILGPLARGAAGVGLMGGALEGAAAGGLGAAGHGGDVSDIAQGAGMGALTGGAAGALSRIGAPKPTPPAAADLLATAKQGFDDAGLHLFDNADIRQGMMNVRNEISQQPNRVTRLGQGAFDQIEDLEGQALGKGAMSGEDLNDYIKALHNNETGDAVPIAGQIAQKHLNLILDQAQPISGQPIGSAGDAIRAANDAFGRAQDLERLGDDPTDLTKAAVKKTMGFYDPGDPEYQTLDALQQAMQPKFNFWTAKHIAAPVIGGLIHGGMDYLNPAEGQNRYLSALEGAGTGALEGAAIYGGGHALARARPARALTAAQYAIGTGQAPPAATRGPLGNALLNVIMGQAASNQSPF